MATIPNRHNPSFALFPVNNPRTAWRPYGLPAILVVPHRRDVSGTPLANSAVFSVRIYIEGVPTEALVAGHDNVGRRFPNREIYSENVDSLELAERQIDVANDVIFLRDGVEIEGSEAKEGDVIQFVSRSGIKDSLEYYPDADYYDLSDFLIDIETLPPDRYNLVYESQFFTRTVTEDGQSDFLCIDASSTAVGQLEFELNHPGEVMEEFYNLTPPPYLTNAIKSQDTTVGLYQPFTDILQDVYDEQDLLEQVNWVFEVPAEAIPYLSAILGWEIPYFPQSLDVLRRAVLRRTVELQNLKGSRRAIINIFRLFGFEILISNLWWSSDGERFIRPGQTLPDPYADEEIELLEQCQVDLLFDDYDESGFAKVTIPLAYRAQVQAGFDDFKAVQDGGDVTIEAYRVVQGSEAHAILTSIADNIQNNPSEFATEEGECSTDENGFLSHSAIADALNGVDFTGFSQILVSGKLGEPSIEVQAGQDPPIVADTVSLDRETNRLTMTINGYVNEDTQFRPTNEQSESIFAFAIYKRQDTVVPSILQDLQSNRFDLQVLTDSLSEIADPTTLSFALQFLFRLKAFHSLLNVIRTNVDFTESYEVTDWCVGGDTQQRYDIDAGMLQVPPAIIPNIPSDISDCTRLDPNSLGYKPEDIELRNRKLAALPEEFQAYQALSDRSDLADAAARLAPLVAATARGDCQYTPYGQDRIKIQDRVESRDIERGPDPNAGQQIAGLIKNPRLSPVDESAGGGFNTTCESTVSNSNSATYGSFTREFTELREAHCELDGSDYCYAGRVGDELLYQPTILQPEHPRCKPCSISMGVGVYYMFPSYSVMSVPGTKSPCQGSSTERAQFSGKAPSGTIQWFQNGIQKDYLTASYNAKLPKKNDSWLGHLYRGYDSPQEETLHYWNNVTMPNSDQRYNLALQRPSLEIEKTDMHLPGTRFIRMHALEEDFAHPTWEARPWDDAHSSVCGPTQCGPGPEFLNVRLVTDQDGNETMVFDSESYIALGNGLTPDIWNMSTTSDDRPDSHPFEPEDVIHSIYSAGANDSPYVELDQLCGYDQQPAYDSLPIESGVANISQGVSTYLEFITANPVNISAYEPIFQSYNDDCQTEIFDFADGYPCNRGWIEGTLPTYPNYLEVVEGLGLTNADPASPTRGTYFTLGSGILVKTGLRVDCGCLLLGCDTTGATNGWGVEETICSTDLFIDQDGDYDFNCDHLEVNRNMTLVENVGTCSIQLDGAIPTMLETLG